MKVAVEAIINEEGHLILTIKDPQKFFKKPKKAKSHANLVIAHYCDEYLLRYKTSPFIGPKTAGVGKRIANSMSLDRAKELITHFITMNDSYFLQRRHDLAVFENDINKVHVSLVTGFTLSQRKAREAEQDDQTALACRSFLEQDA